MKLIGWVDCYARYSENVLKHLPATTFWVQNVLVPCRKTSRDMDCATVVRRCQTARQIIGSDYPT